MIANFRNPISGFQRRAYGIYVHYLWLSLLVYVKHLMFWENKGMLEGKGRLSHAKDPGLFTGRT